MSKSSLRRRTTVAAADLVIIEPPTVTQFFDPSQPRDDNGRWTSTGGGGGTSLGGKTLKAYMGGRSLEVNGTILETMDPVELTVDLSKRASTRAGRMVMVEVAETSPGIVRVGIKDGPIVGTVLVGPGIQVRNAEYRATSGGNVDAATMEQIDAAGTQFEAVVKDLGYSPKPMQESIEYLREHKRESDRRKAEAAAAEARKAVYMDELRSRASTGTDAEASLALDLLEGKDGVVRARGEVFREELNKKLRRDNLRVDEYATFVRPGELEMQYYIREADSDVTVGEANRKYYHDAEARETRVVHEVLRLSTERRGEGIGSAFLKASEEHYRANGVKQIELFANIDVGGYAWARMGFQWDTTSDMAQIMNIFDSSADLMGPKAKADYAVIRERAIAAHESDDFASMPTPFEFSEIGRGEKTQAEGFENWPGKDFMLGSKWNGKKRLSPQASNLSEAAVVTEFFDPSQPRDTRGRWTRGSGTGGWNRWKPVDSGGKGPAMLADKISGAAKVYLAKGPEDRYPVFVIERDGAGVAIDVRGGASKYERRFELQGIAPHPGSPKLLEDVLVAVKESGLSNSNLIQNPDMLRKAKRALADGWTDGPMPIVERLTPTIEGPFPTPEAAGAMLQERGDYTTGDSDAYAKYVLDYSINQRLRTKTATAEDWKLHDELNAAIERQEPTAEPFKVYRGVMHLPDMDITGSTITDPAFTSTSLLPNIATRFTNGVNIEIAVPPGTKAAAVNTAMTKGYKGAVRDVMYGEAEVLFAPGTKLRILDDGPHPEAQTGRLLRAEIVS